MNSMVACARVPETQLCDAVAVSAVETRENARTYLSEEFIAILENSLLVTVELRVTSASAAGNATQNTSATRTILECRRTAILARGRGGRVRSRKEKTDE